MRCGGARCPPAHDLSLSRGGRGAKPTSHCSRGTGAGDAHPLFQGTHGSKAPAHTYPHSAPPAHSAGRAAQTSGICPAWKRNVKKTNVSGCHMGGQWGGAHRGEPSLPRGMHRGRTGQPRALGLGELPWWGGESPAQGELSEQDGHLQGPDQLHGHVPFWHEADDDHG